jgi:hypothetical protein
VPDNRLVAVVRLLSINLADVDYLDLTGFTLFGPQPPPRAW